MFVNETLLCWYCLIVICLDSNIIFHLLCQQIHNIFCWLVHCELSVERPYVNQSLKVLTASVDINNMWYLFGGGGGSISVDPFALAASLIFRNTCWYLLPLTVKNNSYRSLHP